MSAAAHPDRPVARAESRALDGYCLLRKLGGGGMSTVYLAFRESDGRQFAIKVLDEKLAADPQAVKRFVREVKLSTDPRLVSPHLIRGIDHGRDESTGRYYLVMEYVPGATAQAELDRVVKLSIADAVAVARDVAQALQVLHCQGVIHRDVKPDNILLSPAGVAKLGDFGLAKVQEGTDGQLTAHSQGFGTSQYMPYEQALNAGFVDCRSDIYALGATLYHLLTGELPFPGKNHLEIVARKERGDYRRAREANPEVPANLDDIVARMLATSPRDRYPTAAALISDLDRTGLAAKLPSFGQLDLALQDPLVRTRLTGGTNAPTRPSLPRPPANTGIWGLRWRGRQGEWEKRHAPAEQVVRWLSDGRLPPDTQATRPGGKTFRPLRDYPEFRTVPVPPPETVANAVWPTRLVLGVFIACWGVALARLVQWL